MELFLCLILCVHLNYQPGYDIMLRITFGEKTSNLLLFIKPCDYLSRGEVHSIFDYVPDPSWVLYQMDVYVTWLGLYCVEIAYLRLRQIVWELH